MKTTATERRRELLDALVAIDEDFDGRERAQMALVADYERRAERRGAKRALRNATKEILSYVDHVDGSRADAGCSASKGCGECVRDIANGRDAKPTPANDDWPPRVGDVWRRSDGAECYVVHIDAKEPGEFAMLLATPTGVLARKPVSALDGCTLVYRVGDVRVRPDALVLVPLKFARSPHTPEHSEACVEWVCEPGVEDELIEVRDNMYVVCLASCPLASEYLKGGAG